MKKRKTNNQETKKINEAKNLLRNTFKKDAYLSVNKKIAQKVGINGAIMLAETISKEAYWDRENELDADGFFFNMQKEIQKSTTLSPFLQREAVKKLKAAKMVETKFKGIPKKLYYKIHPKEILDCLEAEGEESEKQENKKETNQQDHKDIKKLDVLISKELSSINNKKNKKKINKVDSKESTVDISIFVKNERVIHGLLGKERLEKPKSGVYDYLWCMKDVKQHPFLYFLALYWKEKEFTFETEREAQDETGETGQGSKKVLF